MNLIVAKKARVNDNLVDRKLLVGLSMAKKLMGKKVGMTQFFDEKGNVVACTVIQVAPNIITQVKTKDTDGYNAIQIGFDEVKTKKPKTIEKRVTKPLRGHFAKSGIAPQRHLAEVRMDNSKDFSVGQELSLELFNDVAYVDVIGVSKGKGFQGVMKMYHFKGGRATHGTSRFHRRPGSIGMRTTPGRCLPGGKRASHMGLERKTTQNLKVVKIIDDCILVKGSVPGARNGLVYIVPAVKMPTKPAAAKK